MSGYLGNPDAESEHALILAENGVEDARKNLPNPNTTYLQCIECGDEIPPERRKANPGCCRCISCQSDFDKRPKQRVRMLDRIL